LNLITFDPKKRIKVDSFYTKQALIREFSLLIGKSLRPLILGKTIAKMPDFRKEKS
jgi:hypothetical protein